MASTQIAQQLADAGVRAVLLKGPAFDQMLYGGVRSRVYSDIDLLVDPERGADAERSLAELGFDPAEHRSAAAQILRRAGLVLGTSSAHAATWARGRDRVTVDLHRALPLVGVPARDGWRALGPHLTTISVVGTELETLDEAASALVIALHAAHHGPRWERAQTDLRRACEVFAVDRWRAAARLARELRSDRPMGIGLGTVPEGRDIANELGLRPAATPRYRLMWAGGDAVRARRMRR